MQRPLTGIRVLEFTDFLAGPYCALQLAALGAEVIKVEQPGRGDAVRHHAPFAGPQGLHRTPQTDVDMSLSILKRGAGRRSITLNLKSEHGRQIVRELLDHTDVMVENLRPGSLQRLGLDYASLQADYPRLVYCSISGYGQDGPYSALPAHDPVIQATTGLMSIIGDADSEPTRTGQLYLSDMVAPLFSALSIVSALRQRDLTGRGQYLDASMFDCLTALLWDEPYDYYIQEQQPLRHGNRSARIGPLNTFPTQDGKVVILAASQNQWERLLQAMDRLDLQSDPRCANGTDRYEHHAFVEGEIAAWTRQLTTSELLERCRQHAVPCGPVQSMDEVMHDPHVQARDILQPLPYPHMEKPTEAVAPRFPVRFSDSDVGGLSPAPPLGADTDRVMQELLNYTPDQIDALRRERII